MFKKIKFKKWFKLRYVFLIMIVFLSFNLSFFYLFNSKNQLTNEEYFKLILNNNNSFLESNQGITSYILKNFLMASLSKPETLLSKTFLTYKENGTNDLDSYENVLIYQKITSYIANPTDEKITSPSVYLYNSHQLEPYKTNKNDIYNITPNVMYTSYLLAEKLNNQGIKTIVETTNLEQFLIEHNYTYQNCYQASRLLLDSAKKKYQSLKYFFDIHRSNENKGATTIKIGDQKYGRVLWIINPLSINYQANYNLVKTFHEKIEENYPNLSRGIVFRNGLENDNYFNQDFDRNTILLEIGGRENEIAEVSNTITSVAPLIKEVMDKAL